MPSLFSMWKRLPMVGLLCAFPWVVLGQAVTKDGGEFAIGRNVRGDQMNPALSLSAAGGYLAWKDNSVDGDGVGIGAQRLGSDFAPVMPGLRVNRIIVGNQGAPQVGRLTHGGQVFVWEAGRSDFPGVYARFMGPLGAFLTPDIKVNRSSYTATNRITTNWVAWRNGVLTNRQFTFTQATTEFREAAHGRGQFGETDERDPGREVRVQLEQRAPVLGFGHGGP